MVERAAWARAGTGVTSSGGAGPREGSGMSAFRILLTLIWVMLASYTAVVTANHGMGLLSIFLERAKRGPRWTEPR